MTKQEVLYAGRVLGRYELLMPVAKGGMAEVWAARQFGTRGGSKVVAVKTILRTALDDARLERMFRAEASVASRIHHPNVVEMLEFDEYDGVLFLAMEWVDGEPLNVVLAQANTQGGIPLDIGVNIIGQACLGLHAAHEARDEEGALLGVVHRDVSPQNVLVSDAGAVKLLDFGIAKATARASALTAAGEIKGKFAYMSPEQVSGRELDRRSDVFSLGVLLFMLTTGRHPFRGEHPGETVRRLYSDDPAVPPSRFMSNYPPALEDVLMRALAKPVDARWPTAHELRSALEAALPSAFEGQAEVRLSRYLHGLMGAQLAARRGQLRVAEESLADRRQEALEPVPGSHGSLRAICIEPRRPVDSSAPVSQELVPRSSRSAQAVELRLMPVPAARSWCQTACVTSGTLLLGIALTLGYQKVASSSAPSSIWREQAASSGDIPLTSALPASKPAGHESCSFPQKGTVAEAGLTTASAGGSPAVISVSPVVAPTESASSPIVAPASSAAASVARLSPAPVSSVPTRRAAPPATPGGSPHEPKAKKLPEFRRTSNCVGGTCK
ncbi:MAG TPA: serine/threonine-protein kinase [Polyangiaceae bacterium]|nr:serine/threonine-protein kinase [Polyangiaceae bacterium]